VPRPDLQTRTDHVEMYVRPDDHLPARVEPYDADGHLPRAMPFSEHPRRRGRLQRRLRVRRDQPSGLAGGPAESTLGQLHPVSNVSLGVKATF